MRVCILRRNGISTSSALAIAGKELVEQHLERLVLGHDVVFAQVVTAGGAGVHLRSERPLKTSLRREGEQQEKFIHRKKRCCFLLWLHIQATPVGTRYLANIVCADGGDGLEGQLLAAHAHEDLLHLAQEILHMCTDRNMKGMQTG